MEILDNMNGAPRPDADLIEEIVASSRNLHAGGVLSPRVLRALCRHLTSRQVRHSVETGSGASTLVFSHLSRSHFVFACDGGSGSITRVRASPLFNAATTTFVEGPTQRTLPAHSFQGPIQAALLDGPHAFPFPALEYFYLYPHLEPGALLIVDDIHIRSMQDFFRFLRADEMVDLIEVLDRTAFFRRTAAPTFNPLGDGWWMQGYNRRLLWRYVWWEQAKRAMPEHFKRPFRSVKEWVRSRLAGPA